MGTCCQLVKSNVSAAGHVTISLENDTIREAIAKDRSTKPRIREIPKAIYGEAPLAHIGSMILERLAAGYQVVSEDGQFTLDRLTSAFVENTSGWLMKALRETLSAAQHDALLRRDAYAQHHGMLLAGKVVNDQLTVRAIYQRSALTVHSATFLALLNRCSQHTETADHAGNHDDLATLVKRLVQYDTLGDTALDRLQGHGIVLRAVDFRQLATPMTGFVGI